MSKQPIFLSRRHMLTHVLPLGAVGAAGVANILTLPLTAQAKTASHTLQQQAQGAGWNQGDWRWCNKCQGLAFAGNAQLGRCPAGGEHSHNGSGNYVLLNNATGAPGQSNWQWCNKCQGLTFAGSLTPGTCAAGGQHDHSGSGNYTIVQNNPQAPGQSNWRWCNKCQWMTFAGAATLGACPTGGQHDHGGSGNYVLQGLPNSAIVTWSAGSLSAGNVTCNSSTFILRQDGSWRFYGSLHDSSTFYGDTYALGIAIGSTEHAVATSGTLGAEFSGPARDKSFNESGADPWVAQNWSVVASSVLHRHLQVKGDIGQAVSGLIGDLKQYGPGAVTFLAGVAALV